MSKELVIMVEGPGDERAARNLAERMLRRREGVPSLYVGETYRVRDIYHLLAPPKASNPNGETKWISFLRLAEKRPNLGGVLLLLDGDAKAQRPITTPDGKKDFCPADIGRYMIDQALRKTRAGQTYSLAVVFACQEFESWLLAGVPELAARTTGEPLEIQPRNAKKRIWEITGKPYDETTDQLKFTREIDIDALLRRQPPMRSFHRFEHAVRQLGESATSGNHACSPRQPD